MMKMVGSANLKKPVRFYYQLFVAFLRVGLLGYGGGPTSIPLVYKEVVENYEWMDSDEFIDILAIGNMLPGPIATKMAGYIGYHLANIPGLICALIAITVPTSVMMVLILGSIGSIRDKQWIHGMTSAILPLVGVMLTSLSLQFFNKSKVNVGWGKSAIIVILSLISLEVLKIHPGFFIFFVVLVSLAVPSRIVLNSQKEDR